MTSSANETDPDVPVGDADRAPLTDVCTITRSDARSALLVASLWGIHHLYSAGVSRVCVICSKKPGFGHNRSHSIVATKRRVIPSLQHIRIMLDGSPTRAYVCTRCLKGG